MGLGEIKAALMNNDIMYLYNIAHFRTIIILLDNDEDDDDYYYDDDYTVHTNTRPRHGRGATHSIQYSYFLLVCVILLSTSEI